jgi:drug/metabolite transporter (DMT)-like permease
VYGYVAAFVSAALVGSIFPIAKPILASQIQPLTLSSMTYLIAGFFMLPITLIGKRNKKEKESLKKDDYVILLIIGLLGGGIAPFLFFEGLKRTTASDASVLEGGELLFTVIIALLFFKEKLTKIGYMGIAITIIGITLISSLSSNTNGQFNLYNFNLNYGNILIIFSTLCWGLDNNISKIISKRITNTAKIVLLKSLIGGIFLLAVSFFLGYKVIFEITQIPYILILGIGGFGLSLFFFIESLRIIGTLKTIVIFSSSAIFGLILSFIILNEKIEIMQLFAAALVILGLYYVNKDELNYLKTSDNNNNINI